MEKTVFFRAFEEEDIDSVYKWKNDDELNNMTVGLNRRICYNEVAEWVKSKMPHNPYEAYWAICSQESGKIIGWACLTKIHYINSSVETGAIVIGDKNYQDGFAWIETVLFLLEYAFERLGLNRVYGESLIGHKISNFVEELVFMTREGVLRQAAFKNGQFYDVSMASLLKEEYFAHKAAGDYELPAVIQRLKKLRKQQS